MAKYITPLIFILISQAAGIIGSVFTASAIPTWYAALNKPVFNPPGWLFGPVWILLYTAMGIAAFLVWRKLGVNPAARGALILFFIHLAFNTLWTLIFFGLKNPGAAFAEIIVLWIMILALIILFYKIDSRSAYLMIPYILWVSFAAILNYSIWRLNG